MKYDIIIIGGGIVGLATGYHLIKKNPQFKVAILEKESEVACHQTGHNSGVIHSGIYYKPGSSKAINCLRGYDMLIEFAKQYDIPYELCGKIIVATDEKELAALENIYHRGIENGLQGLRKINEAQIKEYEPHCAGISGIVVPQTGIINYKQVSLKLAEIFIEMGGEIYYNEKVVDIIEQDENIIKTDKNIYHTTYIINCAGLFCDTIAALSEDHLNVRIIPFRGEYYILKKEKQYLVKNLIYPVPDPNFPFLGVHFTRMIGGGIEAGPNAVFAFGKEAYKKTDFNLKELWQSLSWPGFRKVAMKYWKTGMGEFYRSFSKSAFTKALQRLIPEVQKDDLQPGGSGIRAQACSRDGQLLDDFSIVDKGTIIHVLNAPSPAATSSLSIGLTIAEMMQKRNY